MRFDVMVDVRLRGGIADPAGATIERALPALGYEGVTEVSVGKTVRFTIEAADSESEAEDDDEEPEIVLQFSFPRHMAEELAERAIEIVSAGRPRCPLCSGPIDPDGHICPKSNGHHSGTFELA